MAEKLRLEGPAARRDARADLAEAHDADGLARELGADELRLLPAALRHRGGRLRHAPQEREEHRERVLDGGDDVARRRVEDDDAARGGRGHVDVVDPDAGPSDDGELRRRGEEGRVDLRRAADEQRVGVLQGREQLLARGPGDVDDLVPGLAQELEPGARDLFGDDDAAQAAASPAASSSASRSWSREARSTSPMCPMRKVVGFHFP